MPGRSRVAKTAATERFEMRTSVVCPLLSFSSMRAGPLRLGAVRSEHPCEPAERPKKKAAAKPQSSPSARAPKRATTRALATSKAKVPRKAALKGMVVPRMPGAGYAQVPDMVFDAQAWVAHWLDLPKDGTLRLFHRSKTLWNAPEERATIDLSHATMVHGCALGAGFYVKTAPDPTYGPYELQIEIPVAALAGLEVFEGRGPLPEGVFMKASRNWAQPKAPVEIMFDSNGQEWLNEVATRLHFDPRRYPEDQPR